MVKAESYLGVGLYSIADAGRLTGAHPETVRRWVGDRGGIVPLHFAGDRLLTFEELMEVHFIQLFRAEGVSFQAIRRASKTAAKRFHTSYPFTFKRFDTDGETIFATLIRENPDDVLIEDLQHGQYVFEAVVRPFFRKLEYPKGKNRIARFWPREKKGRIVLDPQRKFGQPIDSQTGVTTTAIYDAVRAGGGQQPDVVARWLGISVAAVNAAIEFERSLR